jgi:hypothetical protein
MIIGNYIGRRKLSGAITISTSLPVGTTNLIVGNSLTDVGVIITYEALRGANTQTGTIEITCPYTDYVDSPPVVDFNPPDIGLTFTADLSGNDIRLNCIVDSSSADAVTFNYTVEIITGTKVVFDWAKQSEVLFYGLYSEISGGRMPNKVTGAVDYLTVAGSAGSETYQAPHNPTYESADTDYIWFKTDSSQRTTTTAELIAYDFSRTIVKYQDVSPYAIESIMILGSVLSTAKENRMRDDFHLSIWWNNVLSSTGNLKGNRGPNISSWVAESIMSAEYAAIYNAFVTKPSDADMVIQRTMIDAFVTAGLYAKAELIDIFAAHGNAESLFNWKNPTGIHNPTLNNAPTWQAYKGYLGNAAGSKSVSLNFNLSTNLTIASQNSLCVIIGIQTNLKESITDFGCVDGTKYIFIQSWNTSNNTLTGMCGSADTPFTSRTKSNMHICMSRESSTTYDVYENKSKVTVTRNSAALPNSDLKACGSTGVYCNKQLSYVLLFSGLNDSECDTAVDIMEAYLDNYGNGLI